MSTITCPSCQTIAPPGAIFCDSCGYDLRTVSPQAVQPTPHPGISAQAGGLIVCPTCQHENIPGSVFCENCGTQLLQPQPVSQTPEAFAAPEAAKPVGVPGTSVPGELFVQVSNSVIPFPADKPVLVIGREDPVSGAFPDINLELYGGHEAGVGRHHAQILNLGNQVFIEDLESVNGTILNRQRLAPHQRYPIKDGDEIRMGKIVLIYRTH